MGAPGSASRNRWNCLKAKTIAELVGLTEWKRSPAMTTASGRAAMTPTGVVQAGGETIGSLRKTLASPLDLFRHVDQEIERRLRILVKKGTLNEKEAADLESQLKHAGEEDLDGAPMPSDEEIEKLLNKHDVPTRTELQELSSQLEALVAKLDTLSVDD
jgi:polyhydroxyalkanoate synthesis regulator phasin